MLGTRQPIVANDDADFERLNIPTVPGTDSAKSLAAIPIINNDRVFGGIQIENHERENAFGESEIRLLTTIAASLGTALENARLFDETQRLLKETEQRNAELAIINSVQNALAQNLDIQTIYDIVGDKIQEIFDAQSVMLVSYDKMEGFISAQYVWEKGERFYPTPSPISQLHQNLILNRKTLVFNENADSELTALGASVIEGTEPPLSAVFVPLLAGNRVFGMISLQNMDREQAFPESDVRLLETLASSMSVALENARLFNETQRLLKETESRAQELAIINSVGEAMSRQLDMQTITRTVGDKVREIFDADAASILLLEQENDPARL
jgi:GAF domain-containing protein